MTILVTGGTGYIGSHMVYALLDAGEPVIILDDLSTCFSPSVPAEVPLFVGGTGDATLLSAIIAAYNIRTIIHFAASTVVPDSVADPLGYYANNTSNSRTLIETAIKGGVSYFIFSSTAAVYGSPKIIPVAEDAGLAPESPYGRSKLMTEIMLRDACAVSPMSYVILRYFNVAGADPGGRTGQSTPGATHLIKVAAQVAVGLARSMQIYGTDYPTHDGTCVRDYIHVSDLVAAHLNALAYIQCGGASATFNCGYGRGYSVKEVIETVKCVSGVDFPVRVSGRRPGDIAAVVADNSKILRDLSWVPRFDDLEQIVSDALAWERKLLTRRQSV